MVARMSETPWQDLALCASRRALMTLNDAHSARCAQCQMADAAVCARDA